MNLNAEILNEEADKINLHGYKNLVLLIGNTGSGKSTTAQFIIGNTKLKSVPTTEGSFIIEDDDKISSSIISKTLHPEIIVDTSNSIAFCDCPGFNDTRDETHDITGTYLMKKVIDSTDKVKILLVASHHAVQKGIDRRDFCSLLRHVTTLIKNIDKFKNGIGLLVTKIQNVSFEGNDNFTLVPDDVIRNGVAEYLKEIKESISTNADLRFAVNASKLIDFLLLKENENYVKLEILRVPNKAGPVNQIQLLQNEKRNIIDLINENMKYVSKENDDFGFTISDSSLNAVYNLADQANLKIMSYSFNMKQLIQEHYLTLVKKSNDMFKLKNILNLVYNIWLNMLSNISEEESVETYKIKLLQTIHSLKTMEFELSNPNNKVIQCEQFLPNITKEGTFLNFLDLISNKQHKHRALEWTKPFQDVASYVKRLKNWIKFILDLYARLSEYDIQKDTTKYNVANIADWGTPEKKQGIEIHHETLETFLAKINEICSTISIANMNLDMDMKLLTLNQVLRSTLDDRIVISDDMMGKLTVKGNYIKISQLCNDMRVKKSKSVQIFALNTIFIDDDLVSNGEIKELVMIAPKWVVKGSRIINMEGKSGAAHESSKASVGKNGLPGLPGECGGRFFGIGQEFVNGECLTVSVDGGRGGSGQEGGDGLPGADGTNAELPDDTYFWMLTNSGLSFSKFPYRMLEFSGLAIENPVSMKLTYVYEFFGLEGKRGNSGGNGGLSGKGGRSGSILLYANNSDIIKSINTGEPGLGGKGGNGGLGGKNGNTVQGILNESTSINIAGNGSSFTLKEVIPKGNASTGDAGKDNINDEGIQDSAIPERYIQEPIYYVQDFKTYLNMNMDNMFKKQSLMKFDNYIDSILPMSWN